MPVARLSSPREASIDGVDVFFVVGIDEVWYIIYGVYWGGCRFVQRFSIAVKILVCYFDCLCAAEVFHLVVDCASDFGREFS